MTALLHRLRLAFIVAWILGFFLGQWILLVTGLAHAVGSIAMGWRVLALLAAYIVLMYIVDRLWRASSERRSVAREFVDALILGAFLGLAFAR